MKDIKTSEIYDICIIGGGPAGLCAGIYAARRSLKTILFGKEIGGQASSAHIENYPGIPEIDGSKLIQTFQDQAKRYGAEIATDEVISIQKNNEIFSVQTIRKGVIHSRAMILACGKIPRNLGVPGEREFFGQGVDYCTTVDPSFYAGQEVVIIGGGSSALQSAVAVSRFAKKVTLIHRRDVFSAEATLVNRIGALKNIVCMLSSIVLEICGDERVRSVHVASDEGKPHVKINADAVLIHVGLESNLSFLGSIVQYDVSQRIIVNEKNETSCAGIFAAGDATTVPYYQVVIAAGEGAKAALSAYHFIQAQRGQRSVRTDWVHKSCE